MKEPPKDWQSFGFLKIRQHFQCYQLGLDIHNRVNVGKPLPPRSMKTWQMILYAYNKEVDSSYKFDQIVVPPTQGYTPDEIGTQ